MAIRKCARDYGGYRDDSGVHHLNVLDFQRQLRTCPKPVVAMVAGYSIGGGHVLHMMCDLTIAADNAIFGRRQKVRLVRRRLGRVLHGAHRRPEEGARNLVPVPPVRCHAALDMGTVNTVVPLADWRRDGALVPRMLQNSPMALRCLKAALNADCDGRAGLQELAGNATMLFYMTDEGQERAQRVQRSQPDFTNSSVTRNERGKPQRNTVTACRWRRAWCCAISG